MSSLRFLMACLLIAAVAQTAGAGGVRSPAVPLVTCDPYFSIWSPADKLTDTDTVHWTGKPHRLTAVIDIDGSQYRVIGRRARSRGSNASNELDRVPHTDGLHICRGWDRIEADVSYIGLPDDLDILSRPVTYLLWDVASTDQAAHNVKLSFTASGELAVNTPDQEVNGSVEEISKLSVVKIGSAEQQVLAKRGDDIRIDWGYLYVAAPSDDKSTQVVLASESGRLPAAGGSVRASVAMDFGSIRETPASRSLVLAYDDLYSIQYMKKNLRPYWRRTGWEAADLLQAAARDMPVLRAALQRFRQGTDGGSDSRGE